MGGCGEVWVLQAGLEGVCPYRRTLHLLSEYWAPSGMLRIPALLLMSAGCVANVQSGVRWILRLLGHPRLLCLVPANSELLLDCFLQALPLTSRSLP